MRILLAFLISCVSIHAAQVLPEPDAGLVFWWTYDGKSLYAQSNDATLGTLNGTCNIASNGVKGACWWGNGSTGYFSTRDLDIPTGGITISAWVKEDSLSNPATVVGKGADTFSAYTNFILRMAAGKPKFDYSDGVAYQTWTTTAAVITAGTWCHVALAFTFGTGSSMTCYLNGVAVSGSWISGDGSVSPVQNNQTVEIGSFNLGSGGRVQFWNGLIDDVRIYNRAISASEVYGIFVSTHPNTPSE